MPLAALAMLLAAQSPAPQTAPAAAPVLTSADARDVHSYAQPLEARVTHVSLNLYADFDTHVMRGIATLSVDAKPDARQLVVDDNGLRIVTVTDDELRLAMLTLFNQLKIAVEPACAAPVAALLGPLRETLQGRRVGILLSGTNTDAATFTAHIDSARALPQRASHGSF